MITFAILYFFFSALVGAFALLLKRNGLLWFILAIIISPILAFIILVIMGNPKIPGFIASFGEKTCPQCAEKIKNQAIICRYCGFKFEGISEPQKSILYSDIKPLIFTERKKSKFKTREEYEKWRQSKMSKIWNK